MARYNGNGSRNLRTQFRSILPFKSADPGQLERAMDISLSQSSSPNYPVSPLRAGRTIGEVAKEIDDLRKENFNLKLRIFFLEGKMTEMCGQEPVKNFKVNIELQIELKNTRKELEKAHDDLSVKDKMLDQALKTSQENLSELRKKSSELVNLKQRVHALNKELQSKEEKFVSPLESESESAMYKVAFGMTESISKTSSPSQSVPVIELKEDLEQEKDSKNELIAIKQELEIANKYIKELENANSELQLKSKKKNLSIKSLVKKIEEQHRLQSKEMWNLMEEGMDAVNAKDKAAVASVVNKIKIYFSELMSMSLEQVFSTTSQPESLEKTFRVQENSLRKHSEVPCRSLSDPSPSTLTSDDIDMLTKLQFMLDEKSSAFETLQMDYNNLKKEYDDVCGRLPLANVGKQVTEQVPKFTQALKSSKTLEISDSERKRNAEIQCSLLHASESAASLSGSMTEFEHSNDINSLKEESLILKLKLEEKEKETTSLENEIEDLQEQLQVARDQKDIFSQQALILQQHLEKLVEFLEQCIQGESFSSSTDNSTEMLKQITTCLNSTLQLSQSMSQNLSSWDFSKNFSFDDSMLPERGPSLALDDRSLPLSDLKPTKEDHDTEGRAAYSETYVQNMCRAGRRRRWSLSSQFKQASVQQVERGRHGIFRLNDSEEIRESTESQVKGSDFVENQHFEGRSHHMAGNGSIMSRPKPRPCWNLPDRKDTFSGLRVFSQAGGDNLAEIRPFCDIGRRCDTFISSESDIWSEPDREISIQRIGIEVQAPSSPAQKRRGKEKSTKEDTSTSTINSGENYSRRKRSGSQSRVSVQLIDKRLSVVECQQNKFLTLQQSLEQLIGSLLSQLSEESFFGKIEHVEKIADEISNLKSTLKDAMMELQGLKETLKDSKSQEVGLIQEMKGLMGKVLKAVQSDEHLKDVSPDQAKDIAKQALSELNTFKEQLLSVTSSLLPNETAELLNLKHKSSEELAANVTHLELLIEQEKSHNSTLMQQLTNLSHDNETLRQQLNELQYQLNSAQRPQAMTEKEVDSLDLLQEELKLTKEKLKAMESKCIAYEHDIASVSKEKGDVLSENQTLKDIADVQKQRIDESGKQLRKLQLSCEQLQNDVDEAQNEIAALELKCKTLNDNLLSLSKEKETLIEENATISQKNKSMSVAMQSQMDKLADMNKKYIEYNNEKIALHNKIRHLEMEVKSLQRKLQENDKSVESKKQNFDLQFRALEIKLSDLRQELPVKDNLIHEKDEIINDLNKKVQFLDDRYKALSDLFEQEHSEFMERLSSSGIEPDLVKSLSIKVIELNSKVQNFSNELNAKDSMIQEQKTLIDGLQHDLQALASRDLASKDLYKSIEQKALVTEHSKNASAFENLEKQLRELNTQTLSSKKELESKDTIIQEQVHEIKKLEDEISALKSRYDAEKLLNETLKNAKSNLKEHRSTSTEDTIMQSLSELQTQFIEKQAIIMQNTQTLTLNKELESKDFLIQEQVNEIEKLKGEISVLKSKYDATKMLNEALKNTKSNQKEHQSPLTEDIILQSFSELQKQLTEKQVIIMQNAQIQSLEKKLGSKNSVIQEQLNEIKKLNDKISALYCERNVAKLLNEAEKAKSNLKEQQSTAMGDDDIPSFSEQQIQSTEKHLTIMRNAHTRSLKKELESKGLMIQRQINEIEKLRIEMSSLKCGCDVKEMVNKLLEKVKSNLEEDRFTSTVDIVQSLSEEQTEPIENQAVIMQTAQILSLKKELESKRFVIFEKVKEIVKFKGHISALKCKCDVIKFVNETLENVKSNLKEDQSTSTEDVIMQSFNELQTQLTEKQTIVMKNAQRQSSAKDLEHKDWVIQKQISEIKKLGGVISALKCKCDVANFVNKALENVRSNLEEHQSTLMKDVSLRSFSELQIQSTEKQAIVMQDVQAQNLKKELESKDLVIQKQLNEIEKFKNEISVLKYRLDVAKVEKEKSNVKDQSMWTEDIMRLFREPQGQHTDKQAIIAQDAQASSLRKKLELKCSVIHEQFKEIVHFKDQISLLNCRCDVAKFVTEILEDVKSNLKEHQSTSTEDIMSSFSELQMQLTDQQVIILEQENKCSSLKKENQDLLERLKKLTDRNENLQKNLDFANSLLTDKDGKMDEVLQEKENSYSMLKTENDELKERNHQLESRPAQSHPVDQQRITTRKIVQQQSVEILPLDHSQYGRHHQPHDHEQIARIHQQIIELNKELNQVQSQNEELKTHITNLKSELSQKSLVLSQKESELSAYDSKLKSLQTSQMDKQSELVEQENIITDLKQQNRTLEEEISQLRKQLATSISEVNMQRETLQNINTKVKHLEKDKKELEDNLRKFEISDLMKHKKESKDFNVPSRETVSSSQQERKFDLQGSDGLKESDAYSKGEKEVVESSKLKASLTPIELQKQLILNEMENGVENLGNNISALIESSVDDENLKQQEQLKTLEVKNVSLKEYVADLEVQISNSRNEFSAFIESSNDAKNKLESENLLLKDQVSTLEQQRDDYSALLSAEKNRSYRLKDHLTDLQGGKEVPSTVKQIDDFMNLTLEIEAQQKEIRDLSAELQTLQAKASEQDSIIREHQQDKQRLSSSLDKKTQWSEGLQKQLLNAENALYFLHHSVNESDLSQEKKLKHLEIENTLLRECITDLEGQLDASRNELSTLIESSKGERNILDDENLSMKNDVSTLKQSENYLALLNTEKSRSSRMTTHLTNLQDGKQFSSTIKHISELATLTIEKEALQKEILDLDTKSKTLEAQIAKYKLIIHEQRLEIEQLLSSLNTKTKLSKDLEKQIHTLESKLEFTRKSSEEKIKLNNKLEAKILNKNDAIKALESTKHDLENEARLKMMENQNKVEALESKMKELQMQVAKKDVERLENSKVIDKLKTDLSSKNLTIKELEASETTKHDLANEAHLRMMENQNKVEALESQMKELQMQVSKKDVEISENSKVIDKLKADLSSKNLTIKELEALKTMKTEMQKHCNAQEAKIKDLQLQVDSLNKELSNLRPAEVIYPSVLMGSSIESIDKISAIEQSVQVVSADRDRSENFAPSSVPSQSDKLCRTSLDELPRYKEEIRNLRKKVKSKDEEISQLQISNSNLHVKIAELETKFQAAPSAVSKVASINMLDISASELSIDQQTADFMSNQIFYASQKTLSTVISAVERDLQKDVKVQELILELSQYVNVSSESISKCIAQLCKASDVSPPLSSVGFELPTAEESKQASIERLKNDKFALIKELKVYKQHKLSLENQVQELLLSNKALEGKNSELYNAAFAAGKQRDSRTASELDKNEMAIMKHLHQRKWGLQQSILRFQKELCKMHPSNFSKQVSFIDHVVSIYNKIQLLSGSRPHSDTTIYGLISAGSHAAKEHYLSLQMDVECLRNTKLFLKYFVVPFFKTIKSYDSTIASKINSFSENISRRLDVESWSSIELARNAIRKESDSSVEDFKQLSNERRIEKQMLDLTNELSSVRSENVLLRNEIERYKKLPMPSLDMQSEFEQIKQSSEELKQIFLNHGLAISDANVKDLPRDAKRTFSFSRSESIASLSTVSSVKHTGEHKRHKEHVPVDHHISKDWAGVDKNIQTLVGDQLGEEQVQRSHYSSPDLGIESDPNQEHFTLEPRKVPDFHKPQQMPNFVYGDINQWGSAFINIPYAFIILEDFELLKKEVEECIVAMKSIESRVHNGLKFITKDGTPKKSFECSTLKGILDCCTNAGVCLFQSQNLMSKFKLSLLPSNQEGKLESELFFHQIQKLESALAKVTAEKEEQDRMLIGAMDRLKKFEKKKELFDRAVSKRLARTKKVLRQVKGNILYDEAGSA